MTAAALHVVEASTSDPGVAAEVMESSFPGIEFGPGDDGAPFRFAHHRVADDVFSVNSVSLTGRAISRGEFPDVVAAGRVRRGRYTIDYGRHRLDTTRPYLRPSGRQFTRFHDVSAQLVSVQPSVFARQAAAHLAGSGAVLRPVGVDNSAPVSPEAVVLWHSTLDHITAVASDLDVFALPMVRATLLDLYVATMLAAFPLTYDRTSAAGAGATPGALRRALAFVEEHLAEPVTVPMIAEAAGLSVRGLHRQFTTRLGTTPLRHLQQLRLRAAHDDLLAADPSTGDTTAAIARRWGFAHPSRFAQQYRDVFGELPSRTLRR